MINLLFWCSAATWWFCLHLKINFSLLGSKMQKVLFCAFKQNMTTKEVLALLTGHTGIKLRSSYMLYVLDTTKLCLEHLSRGVQEQESLTKFAQVRLYSVGQPFI